MSHELRTSLNAVIGFSEIITDQTFGPFGNPKYRDYAKDIHDAGEHLLDLINDILDLSKVEAGMEELHDEPHDVAEIVAAVSAMVKGRANAGEVDLRIEVPGGLPKLRADARRLKQVLVNLLSNAIKFTKPVGRVVLKVGLRIRAVMFRSHRYWHRHRTRRHREGAFRVRPNRHRIEPPARRDRARASLDQGRRRIARRVLGPQKHARARHHGHGGAGRWVGKPPPEPPPPKPRALRPSTSSG